MPALSNWFMRLAVTWFVVGVAHGIAMAASHDHGTFPVHAHINLLGWVSMALFAGFYRLWPQAARNPLAKVHFWLYAPAHLVMMVTLAALYRGMREVEPVLGIASAVVGLGVVCFAAVAWKATASGTAADAPAVDAAPRVA